MKCGVIDVGTNTVLLLIAGVGGEVDEIMDMSTITRLGEGLKATGRLERAAMDRVFSCIAAYRDLMDKHGVEKVYAVGTSALREAMNGPGFVAEVRDRLGVSIRVITGEEEAYYTYLSVAAEPWAQEKRSIVVDVGGGSTEVIEGKGRDLIRSVSLPIGSVRLTEMFIRNDPPRGGELVSLSAWVRDSLDVPVPSEDFLLVETGGTITNLASMVLGLREYDKKRIHGLVITAEEVGHAIDVLAPMTAAERSRVPGIEKGREDIIVQGFVIVREIMRYFGKDEVVVSANGVRFGVLLHHRERGLADWLNS